MPQRPEKLQENCTGIVRLLDLEADCILGFLPEERQQKRTVRVNLEMSWDFFCVQDKDFPERVPDYSLIAKKVRSVAKKTRAKLLEHLCQKIALELLQDFDQLLSIRVLVKKPAPMNLCAQAEAEIFQKKS